ncbi:MAG: UvrD-helicase domain-containing protein, partial [Deltaproteobacteria bacterium]|jgi:DNA helicase-2/ATP-dependent DNA helicase PcrA|nr:UvrD-helicase domain-containing protein [Deltaproteobacteria bacterium]
VCSSDLHRLNYPPSFPVIDREDQKAILTKIYEEMGLSSRDLSFDDAIDDVLEAGKLHIGYVEEFMLAWEGPNAAREASRETAAREAARDATWFAPREGPPGRAGSGTPTGRAGLDALKAELARGDLDRNRRIFLSYLREQKRCYSLDFNDLINFALYVLETFPEAKGLWQDRLQYVMVDEFQDVSEKQYRLGEILSGKHNNLFIVGDSDQTIYTWRGSHQKLFLDFPERHPGAETVALSLNYRSTPQILAAAEALISVNTLRYDNPLEAVSQDGYKPVYFNGKTEREAAKWILGEAARIRDSGVPLSDAAVLCRAGYMSRPLEEAFLQAGLPFRVLCGTPFYARREVKTAVCYLRMLAGADDMAFARTVNSPSRKLGKKSLDLVRDEAARKGVTLYEAFKGVAGSVPALWAKAGPGYVEVIEDLRAKRRGKGLCDLFEELLDRTGFEESLRLHGDLARLDNLAELKRAVAEFAADPEATLEDFLDRAALYSSADAEGARDSLSIMTIHTAKGLEFGSVFVCGLNEGLFPSRRCQTWEDMEEERRLMYVAMTRAKRRLMLCGADFPHSGGPSRRPSRFLYEISGEIEGARPKDLERLLENASPGEAPGAEPGLRNPASAAAPAFSEGDAVEHPSFGRGEIIAINLRAGSYSVKFDALSTSRDIMFGANLVKA